MSRHAHSDGIRPSRSPRIRAQDLDRRRAPGGCLSLVRAEAGEAFFFTFLAGDDEAEAARPEPAVEARAAFAFGAAALVVVAFFFVRGVLAVDATDFFLEVTVDERAVVGFLAAPPLALDDDESAFLVSEPLGAAFLIVLVPDVAFVPGTLRAAFFGLASGRAGFRFTLRRAARISTTSNVTVSPMRIASRAERGGGSPRKRNGTYPRRSPI